MKMRLTALLGVALALLTVLVAPAASASASLHPAHEPGALYRTRLADNHNVLQSGGSACLTNSLECLNLTQCNTSRGVQLWNAYNGGDCTDNWVVTLRGTVDPSTTFPFYCGSGLNSAYAGDTVFEVDYITAGNVYVPVSAGKNNRVTVAKTTLNRPRYFVAQDDATGFDTRLIDVTTTCQN